MEAVSGTRRSPKIKKTTGFMRFLGFSRQNIDVPGFLAGGDGAGTEWGAETKKPTGFMRFWAFPGVRGSARRPESGPPFEKPRGYPCDFSKRDPGIG